MEDIKVSVIIPAYNVEKYVDRCLKSVLQQNFEKIEVIVINDGSTDKTLERVEKYLIIDSRIKIINQENKGLSPTRNIGLKNSRGKYIIHLDSDDWIEDGYLQDMYNFMEKYNLDVAISDYWEEVIDLGKKEYKSIEIEKEIISSEEFRELFYKKKINNSLWNKMIRRDILIQNEIYSYEDVTIGEDLAITMRLMYCIERAGKINKAYFHYMRHSTSMTKQKRAKYLLSYLSIFDRVEQYLIGKDKIEYDKDRKQILEFKLEDLKGVLVQDSDWTDSNYREAITKILNLFSSKESLIYINRFSNKYKLLWKLLYFFPSITLFKYIKYILNIRKIRG